MEGTKTNLAKANKMKSLREECKLFKDCPSGWDCLYEIALTGSCGPWSVELCYDLQFLRDQGLITGPPQLETKILRGMLYTFEAPLMQTVEGERECLKK